jgi:hypothetical protein
MLRHVTEMRLGALYSSISKKCRISAKYVPPQPESTTRPAEEIHTNANE